MYGVIYCIGYKLGLRWGDCCFLLSFCHQEQKESRIWAKRQLYV